MRILMNIKKIILLIFISVLLYKSTSYIIDEFITQKHNDIQSSVNIHVETYMKPEDEDKWLVVYNNIPRTGSDGFMKIVEKLSEKNKFDLIHVNVTSGHHMFFLSDQMKFVDNATCCDKNVLNHKTLYYGPFSYISFKKFRHEEPVYISILRDPLERFVSHYYFRNHEDDLDSARKIYKNNMTIDACVAKKKIDCDPNQLWIQIPFICGQSPFCWLPGNPMALEEAKRNLVTKYLLVGVTDDMSTFFSILELVLPSFFEDGSKHFITSQTNYRHKISKKIYPSRRTIKLLKKSKVWKMENEFYKFALEQFDGYKSQLALKDDGTPIRQEEKFRFEKIRPKVINNVH